MSTRLPMPRSKGLLLPCILSAIAAAAVAGAAFAQSPQPQQGASPPPPGAAPAPVSEQAPPTQPQASTPPQSVSGQDLAFMQKAAQSAITEVDFGKLAAEKAPSPSVRQFALRSVATFSRAGGMLNALAGDAGVTLPRQPSPDALKLTEALAHDPAGVIDEEYMAQVLPASTMTVSLFESEAQNGQSPKLKQFASRMLPELQQRRNLAVRLSKSPGSTRQAMRNRAYPQGTPR